VRRGGQSVVGVKAHVPVAAEQRPGLRRVVVTQLRDRGARPLGPHIRGPGCAPFHDRQVPRHALAFYVDLVPGPFGYPRGAPALEPRNVQIGSPGHAGPRRRRRSVGDLWDGAEREDVAGSGLERVECGVQASPPTQVRFGDGRDDVVAVVGASDDALL